MTILKKQNQTYNSGKLQMIYVLTCCETITNATVCVFVNFFSTKLHNWTDKHKEQTYLEATIDLNQ